MIKSRQADWQRRRSNFNHQWLKNRFLSALDAAEQVIRGRIKAVAYWQEFIEVDLPEWQERRENLKILLADFENDMSPRRLFECPPLSGCASPSKEVLADLMHELWRARYPVAECLKKARAAALKVDRHFALLYQIGPVDDAGKVRKEFIVEFEEFRTACRALARAIEKFPDRILVT